MQFVVPASDIQFDLPDDWWQISGMTGFRPLSNAYRFSSDPRWPTQVVPITQIQPPVRDAGVVGLSGARTIDILKGFVADTPLPPAPVHTPPGAALDRYWVRDGYHRYYCSIAAGFSCLPVAVMPYFDIRDPNC